MKDIPHVRYRDIIISVYIQCYAYKQHTREKHNQANITDTNTLNTVTTMSSTLPPSLTPALLRPPV